MMRLCGITTQEQLLQVIECVTEQLEAVQAFFALTTLRTGLKLLFTGLHTSPPPPNANRRCVGCCAHWGWSFVPVGCCALGLEFWPSVRATPYGGSASPASRLLGFFFGHIHANGMDMSRILWPVTKKCGDAVGLFRSFYTAELVVLQECSTHVPEEFRYDGTAFYGS